jgi:hypothetical protein
MPPRRPSNNGGAAEFLAKDTVPTGNLLWLFRRQSAGIEPFLLTRSSIQH